MSIAKTRRKEIKAAVIAVLNKCDIIKLPVNIKYIVKCQDNVRLIPYSMQMQRRNFSKDDMMNFSGSNDGYTDYDHTTGQYVAYYNDTDPDLINTKRYRWTIAHELGHIALKHHLISNDTKIFRSSLALETYNMLEEEADYFAALILVPHIVLLHKKNDIDTALEISRICNISKQASRKRFLQYKKWKRERNFNSQYDQKILELFCRYMYKKECQYCKNSMIYYKIKHCIYCGKTDLKWIGDGKMIYESFIHNECPKCRNEEIENTDNFCIICKEDLRNYCTNNQCDNYIFSAPLPKNARYCPTCGHETEFFQKGYLKPWNDLSNENLDDENLDDELPF